MRYGQTISHVNAYVVTDTISCKIVDRDKAIQLYVESLIHNENLYGDTGAGKTYEQKFEYAKEMVDSEDSKGKVFQLADNQVWIYLLVV